MRPRFRLALVLLATACGARTGLDVLDASVDATSPHDAAPDVHDASALDVTPPVACPNGYYFIGLTDDAGASMLHHGVADSGVPSRACVSTGEDCFFTTAIAGRDDAGTLILVVGDCSCGALALGTYPQAEMRLSDSTGVWFGSGPVSVNSLSPTAALGSYDGVVKQTYDADGGLVGPEGGVQSIYGDFCVLP